MLFDLIGQMRISRSPGRVNPAKRLRPKKSVRQDDLTQATSIFSICIFMETLFEKSSRP